MQQLAHATMPRTFAAYSMRRKQPVPLEAIYKSVLGGAFALFNSLRLFTYLPTILAIVASGSSGQHSLLTWLTWVGANATMAAWLFERNERRLDKTVLLNIGNAAMCLLTGLVIVWYRMA